MQFEGPPTDDEILAVVETWIDDLGREDYVSAYSRTEHDPYYAWTPNLIRTVIEGYGHTEPHPSGEVFKVTDRKSAAGKPFHREVERTEISDSSLAEVRYDLPLNGEWSDLTATFRIQMLDASPIIILEEIHVF